MNAPTVVTIREIGQAVRSCDTYNRSAGIQNMEHILEIAFKKLALAAPISVDLENGHFLNIEVTA